MKLNFVMILAGLMTGDFVFGATPYLRECGDLNIYFVNNYMKTSNVQINNGMSFGCDFTRDNEVLQKIKVFYQHVALEEKTLSRSEEELISEFYAHEQNIYRLELKSVFIGRDKVWCFEGYSENDENKLDTECYYYKKNLKIGISIPKHNINNFVLSDYVSNIEIN